MEEKLKMQFKKMTHFLLTDTSSVWSRPRRTFAQAGPDTIVIVDIDHGRGLVRRGCLHNPSSFGASDLWWCVPAAIQIVPPELGRLISHCRLEAAPRLSTSRHVNPTKGGGA
jgi:hypothetical protein